jgi:hypothetical protein
VRSVDALWAAWDGRGLEHLRLGTGPEGVRADGLLLAVDDQGRPFRARYLVECDPRWRVRRARIERLEEPPAALHLRADGRGHWTDDATGAALPLEGCVDVDIYPSPFTNTLPIRRLADAAVGRPLPIAVAWVVLPDLTVQTTRQEYTLLARGVDGARWRFHAPDSGFTAELSVDPDGLVRDYPGIARRL